MDKLRSLEILVKVADAGSFARAAVLLLITPSAVSHAIAQLERETGITIFYRTTRQLRLSAEGGELVRRARNIVQDTQLLLSDLGGQRDRLAGTLRVAMATGTARHVFMPALPRFLNRYPDIRLELIGSAIIAQMHTAGADLSLRIGDVPDSGLIARPLADLSFGVYASPAYLSRHGTPLHPQDLLKHRTLVHKSPNSTTLSPWDEWSYRRKDDDGIVRVQPQMVTDDREALLVAALSGLGLFRIGMFDPALLSSGQLVRVLDDWQWPGGPVLNLIYRKSRSMPRRIEAFMNFAIETVRAFDPMGLTMKAR